MSVERATIKKAMRLMEEFPDQLTLAEALQISGQVQIAEILYKGLHSGVRDYPPFLEAIAIAMGYKGVGTTTIPEAISELKTNDSLEDIALALGTGGKSKISEALYEVAEVLKRHLK